MALASCSRGIAAIVLSALLTALASCGGDSEGPPATPTIASITLSPASGSIDAAATTTFTAQAFDAGGAPMAGVTFTWNTSDSAIATVSGGVATGVTPGTALISASAGGVTSAGVALTVRAIVAAGGPGSGALIDAALAAGDIDAETALTFHVYAAFNDARLPAHLKGDDSNGFESSAMSDVNERFDTLSEATQTLLVPFMRRPSDVGSWTDPNATSTARESARRRSGERTLAVRPDCLGTLGTWLSVEAPTAKVRVWYDGGVPTHRPVAEKVSNMIETFVWPTLITSYSFKEPASDVSPIPCFGGDSRLDIYIVNPNTLADFGQTIEGFGSIWEGSAHVRIRANLNDTVLAHTVAHEFMHAVNWAYRTSAAQKSYGWFRDALANWAADEVFTGNQSLNAQASCLLRSTEVALADESSGVCDGASALSRSYGAYLPLRFLSKVHGPLLIRSIVEATTLKTTAMDAINSTVPGGLKTQWPLFAKRLWNQDPIAALHPAQHFNAWDLLVVAATNTPKGTSVRKTSADLGGQNQAEIALDTDLNNVSARYYHFSFTEEATRSVMFHNTFYDWFKAGKAVHVQALMKPEGQPWIEEDWTEYEWIGLCRDWNSQRLSDLVIVISSAEWQGGSPAISAAEPPKLKRNNIGCWGFAGRASRTTVLGSWSSGSIVATFDARYDFHPGGTPTQLTDRANGRLRVPVTAPLFNGGNWRLVEGYTSSGCSHSYNNTRADSSVVLGGDSAGELVINNFLESLPADLRNAQVQLTGNQPGAYVVNGVTASIVKGSVTGPQPDCGTTYDTGMGPWLLTRDQAIQSKQVTSDGHLRGTYDDNSGGDTNHYQWDLLPQREPPVPAGP